MERLHPLIHDSMSRSSCRHCPQSSMRSASTGLLEHYKRIEGTLSMQWAEWFWSNLERGDFCVDDRHIYLYCIY